MKKLVLLMLLCFTICMGLKTNASTWSYKWEHTTVEIPVGESIYDYEKIPKARLYKDGIELKDADIKIVTKGDWLYYLSNVNTNVVGDYYVWYKAYEYKYMPGTCHDYKCLITFKVVDNEKPQITPITDNIRIARGTTKFDLNDYFNITDNYDKELDVDFYHNIDTSKVGVYECKVTASDDSKNSIEYNFNVEIYNVGTPPKIEMLVDSIRLKKDSKIELEKYFKVSDDDLDKITTKLYHTINSNIPGIYSCKITASDQFDEVSLDFVVEIYDDNEAPIIIKIIDDIKIEYGNQKYNLKDYFIVTDDYDTKIELTFSHNINVYKLDYYECKVIAKDSSGKLSELEFIVEVYGDITKPTINQLVDEIRIKRKSVFNLNDYFSVTDDSNNQVEVRFYHLIDVNYVGFYNCKIMAIDSNKNSTIKEFIVEVYDDVKPVITFLGEGDELNLYLNQEVIIKSYFKAIDDIDGDITSYINFPSVDKKTPKSFDYTVSVSDLAGNISELTIKMNIVDDIIPEIVLYNDSITLEYGFNIEDIDYLSYVKSINDNNVELDKTNINISSNLDVLVGEYSVIYSYSDSINTVSKELIITVLSSKAPLIIVDDIEICENEVLDLYSIVSVYDESDLNAYDTLTINDDMVDYSKAGRYEVTAYAVNSSALSTTKTFYIVVKEDNIFNNDYVKYVSIGLAVLLVSSVGVFYYIKKKKIKIV